MRPFLPGTLLKIGEKGAGFPSIEGTGSRKIFLIILGTSSKILKYSSLENLEGLLKVSGACTNYSSNAQKSQLPSIIGTIT